MNTSYLQSTLGKDEEIMYIPELDPSQRTTAILLIILGVLLFPFLIIGIIELLDVSKREYVVTNKRIITKKGIISVKLEEIRNEHIVGISIIQGISDRMKNCGTLIFNGVGAYKVKFNKILSPKKAYTEIEKIINQKSF